MFGGQPLRRRAVEALGDIGPDANATSELSEALEDSDRTVRDSAADALAKMGRAAAPAAPTLVRLVRERHISAAPAARALRAAGLGAADAEPVGLELLESPDQSTRQEVAAALGALYPDSRKTADALLDAVKRKDWAVRENLAPALAHSSLKDTLLTPALTKLTADKDELVRVNARCALREIATPAATKAVGGEK